MAKKTLPKQISERVPLQDVIPLSTPFSINLSPTDYCNIRCVFCPFHGEVRTMKRPLSMMALDTIKTIIDRIAEFPDKLKILYFVGLGEPTLHKDLPEMITYAKEKDVTREIGIITNGFNLSPELNRRLIDSGLDLVRVSVPAIDEQTCFEITGTKLNLEKYISNIKNLYDNKREGMTIYCKTTNIALGAKNGAPIDPEKEKEFYSLFNDCCDYAFVENVVSMTDQDASEEAKEKMWIGNSASESLFSFENNHNSVCEKIFFSLTINSLGEVYPCCYIEKPQLLLGNALDDSLVEMWNGEKLRNLRLSFLKNSVPECCKNCEALTFGFPNELHKHADRIIENLIKSVKE